MPKKATSTRSGVQRTKPRTQKSFELVRPVSEVQERDAEETLTTEEPTSVESTHEEAPAIDTASRLAALPTVPRKKARSSSVATEVAPIETVTSDAVGAPVVATKGSASARLAARKNTQRSQRSQAALITAEHYSYVRRDLAFIAVLAAIMFIAIIVLYFVPGIGA
ncbi:MAG: hypothetical protein PVS3B3_14920 [Ktedonobacteraceae bacterium]